MVILDQTKLGWEIKAVKWTSSVWCRVGSSIMVRDEKSLDWVQFPQTACSKEDKDEL